ncbi:hypothetical protein LTR85_002528 [Meristemomyces frigidus]|nr:hypothetical protein LTR85_002528 [Meristemomyces frigidus]
MKEKPHDEENGGPEKVLENSLRTIREARQRVLDGYYAAQTHWEDWQGGYDNILRQHQLRQGQEVSGWSHDCSRSEFEAQYLREGARRARRYDKREDHLYLAFDVAVREGIEPLEWQHQDFPQDDPHYYTSSQEAKMAAAAPIKRISRWLDGLPDAPHELDVGVDGSGHAVEYPEDLMAGVRGEVEMWESISMVAERVRKRRITQANRMVTPGGMRDGSGGGGRKADAAGVLLIAPIRHPWEIEEEALWEQFP